MKLKMIRTGFVLLLRIIYKIKVIIFTPKGDMYG